MSKQSKLIRPIELPGIKIPGNIFLAPLAGYTDAAFRSVCITEGAHLTFTEMISSEAACRKNEKTLKLLKWAPNEKQLAVQIFTANPESAAASVKEIEPYNPSIIDLNCGCSIPKILKSGSGAALHKDPPKVKSIIKAIKNESSCPVSIKIRLGWDAHSINYLEVAEKALEGGIDMITLHPRTRNQLFTGNADWSHLKILKEKFPDLIVLGSGDLFSPEDVKKMLTQTLIDGVMIARGAIGNPFIFHQTIEYLKTGTKPPLPDTQKIINTALKQLETAITIKGEKRACVEMRKQICSYTKGLTNSSNIRKEIVHCSTFKEYEKILEYLLKEKY